MLILQRKKDQRITISGPNGEKIELTITDVTGKNVKIGFDADKKWIILRNELMEGGNKTH